MDLGLEDSTNYNQNSGITLSRNHVIVYDNLYACGKWREKNMNMHYDGAGY